MSETYVASNKYTNTNVGRQIVIIIGRILRIARVQKWQNSSVFAGFCILREICKALTPNPQAKPCRFCTFLMNKSRDDGPVCVYR